MKKILIILVAGIFFTPELFAREIKPINKVAFAFLIESEGFRPKPYRCQAGVETIGYGFTDSEIVKKGYLSKEDAQYILLEEIIKEENYILSNCRARLNQNQRAALISFSFNCGRGSLDKILARINRGDVEDALAAMLRYNKVKKDGVYIVSDGLKNRRKKEVELFQK